VLKECEAKGSSASAALMGINGVLLGAGVARRAASGGVVTVMVKFADVEPSVIDDGLNVAVAPVGRPVAVSVMGLVNGAF
jgi:hypothetical protein